MKFRLELSCFCFGCRKGRYNWYFSRNYTMFISEWIEADGYHVKGNQCYMNSLKQPTRHINKDVVRFFTTQLHCASTWLKDIVIVFFLSNSDLDIGRFITWLLRVTVVQWNRFHLDFDKIKFSYFILFTPLQVVGVLVNENIVNIWNAVPTVFTIYSLKELTLWRIRFPNRKWIEIMYT